MLMDTDIELTYWEGLRVWWRIYWPAQAVAIAVLIGTRVARMQLDPLSSAAIQGVIGAAMLFLLVPRIYARPYRGFAVVIAGPLGEPAEQKLTRAQQGQVWWFVWWRQLVAGLIAGFLAWPTNLVLSLMGIYVGPWITVFAGVLVVGPILMKMLVGNPFETFRFEVKR